MRLGGGGEGGELKGKAYDDIFDDIQTEIYSMSKGVCAEKKKC